MKKLSKVMILYVSLIALGFIVSTIYHNQLLDNEILSGEIVLGFNVVKTIDIDREKIFDVMSDVENYPKILPHNVISIKIINQTQPGIAKIIFAEETVSERGVVITQIVKHNIFQYEQHTITIVSGNAEGTVITLTFKEVDSNTRLTADVKLHIKGILAPFGLLLRSNIESAIDTTINTFVEFAKN